MKKNTAGIVFSIICFALYGCPRGGSSGGIPIPGSEVSDVSLSSTSPADGAIDVAVETSVEAIFSAPMIPGSFTPASFRLNIDNDTGSQVAASVGYDAVSRKATLVPSLPLASKTRYVATLSEEIRDALGRTLKPFSWRFETLDNVRPTVHHLSPACETINLSPNMEVCVEFSERIDPATVTPATFFLKLLKKGGGGGGIGGGTVNDIPVPGHIEVSEDLRSACFIPNSPLEDDSEFRVTLTSGIQDEAHLPLVGLACKYYTIETTPPRVTATTPGAGETEVSIISLIDATFSEQLDPGSVRADSMVVTDPAGDTVLGSVIYESDTKRLIFTPDPPLNYERTYTVKISGTLQDLAGNLMGSDLVWSFTTSGAWGTPGLLEQDGGTVDLLTFAIHPSGYAYAAWEQKQAADSFTNVYANRYVPGSGWGNAVRVSTGVTATSSNLKPPQLAIDPDTKTVHLVFAAKIGTSNKNVYVSTLNDGVGNWTAPVRLSTNAGPASDPSVAFFGGAGYVAWSEKAAGEAFVNIQVDSDLGGLGWGNRVRVSNDLSAATNPSISGGSDKLFAVWEQVDPTDSQLDLVFGSFLSTPTWAPPFQLNSAGNRVVASPLVLGNSPNSSAVVAIWTQEIPADNKENVFVNVFENLSATWGTENPLSSTAFNALNPQIGMDPSNGNVLAIWEEKGPSQSFKNIHTRTFDTTALSWTPQISISDDKSDCTFPSLHVNEAGDSFVAWVQQDPDLDTAPSIYSSYSPGLFGPWGYKLKVSDSPFGSENPRIGSYISGGSTKTIGVWENRQTTSGSSPRDGRFNLLVQ